LHPLIREFFQSQLAHFSNADVLKQQFCQAIVAISRQISRNPVRQKIVAVAPAIPHMEEVATQLSAWLSDEDLSVPYTSLGWFYAGQGTYSQAEPWFVQCLLVTQSRLNSNHLDVAASLNNLAELYQLEGRYSEAEPLCQQSLEIRKNQLGSDHPDVAQSLNDLALLYDYQGRHSEAEPLYWQSLEMRRQQLGNDHLDVAQSLNDFALLSWNQKLYDRAENFYHSMFKFFIIRQMVQ
jgi:tetratricopeptide (TPR) repeat protein